MELNSIFKIIDIFVCFNEYKKIIKESKENVKIAKSENEVNAIVTKFKNDIDDWYNQVLIRSIIIFVILIFCIFLIFHNNLPISIITVILIPIFVSIFSIIAYVIDRYQNKDLIKNELYEEIENSAKKYGISYEKIYVS